MRGKQHAAIVGIALLLVCATTHWGYALGAVYFDPSVAEVSVPDTFTVDISVDAAMSGIHCFRLKVDFLRSNLKLIDIQEGPLLESAGSTFFFWKDTSGVYEVLNCILIPETSANGPGVLATMTLTTGETPCSSPLSFTSVLFQDDILEDIPAEPMNAFVTVTGCCMCPYQSDHDGDGFRTALDLGRTIDILFAGAPDTQDPSCPDPRADFDCDGYSTALDLGRLIDHLFAGGGPPCDPCSP